MTRGDSKKIIRMVTKSNIVTKMPEGQVSGISLSNSFEEEG